MWRKDPTPNPHPHPNQVWRKDLADHAHALLLLNSGEEAADITVRWARDLPDVARRWSEQIEP